MLAGDFAESEHAFLRVLCSSRVSRVADKDCLGLVCDRLLELLDRRDLEAVSDIGRNSLESKAVHECECVVVCVEWLKYDHFVSRITCNLEREVHTFTSCYSHDEFVYSDVDTDLLVIFLNETLAKLHQTS